MKKYSLLKALGICFFVFVVLSFILPAGSFTSGEFTKATTDPVGIFEWFSAPMNTIVNYGMYGIVFLLIGGLYGVLNKTGVYTKVVDNMKKKYEGKRYEQGNIEVARRYRIFGKQSTTIKIILS